jgi:UDP:flavonoid glycosyltransferase YjiC (YdhE family)
VRQLVLPDGADRHINAEAVRNRGAGLLGTADTLDARVLEELLSNEKMAEVTREVREEIGTMPSPTSLVPRLEELAG